MDARSGMQKKMNSQGSRKNTKQYPVSKITILFSAWHSLLTSFNNSIKLIWNYEEGEEQSSISLTPSAHSYWIESSQLEAKSSSREFCDVHESFHGGWWWSECWYNIGSCSTPWRASWRICAVLSRNHQNKTDLVKNHFVVPVENVAVWRWTHWPSERFWGQMRVGNHTICEFWLEVSDTYSNVRRKALKIFPSKYFCESGYSTLFHVKTKPTRLCFSI